MFARIASRGAEALASAASAGALAARRALWRPAVVPAAASLSLASCQTRGYAAEPAKKEKKKDDGKKKKAKDAALAISNLDPTQYCIGLNYMKTGEEVKLKPDSEYPLWLWALADSTVKTALDSHVSPSDPKSGLKGRDGGFGEPSLPDEQYTRTFFKNERSLRMKRNNFASRKK